MYNILIVDDEQVERNGIEAILRRGFSNVQIGQARNGKLAIEMSETFQPDLILMDIKMAGMTGLEAVEQIRANKPKMKFIMITAFDTFDFARQAIKLGVKDYLLKPSKASEIIETVRGVLREIDVERQQESQQEINQKTLSKMIPIIETDVVTQLLFDHVHDVHLEELFNLLEIPHRQEMYVMTIVFPMDAETNYALIREKIRELGHGWIGALNGRQLPVILFRQLEKPYRSQAMALAREILALPNLTPRSGWFIGIGNVVDEMERIRQSYQESLIATIDPSLPVKYRFHADVPIAVPKKASTTDKNAEKRTEKQLFDWIRAEAWGEIERLVDTSIREWDQEGCDWILIQQRGLELLWQVSRVVQEMGVDVESPMISMQTNNIRQFASEVCGQLDAIKYAYMNARQADQTDFVQKMKQYITEHSSENISLEAMAKQVGFSPIYVSKIFKEQVGMNYIDFLTQCRLEKAIRLMGDPEKSMKEIAIEAGYHDPNYFSKVFRKWYHETPSEYRKTLPQIRREE